ncbi:MAG: hypothetical protein FJX80_05060 [Bacteroidetes bacterium]|nr:hypothetical protein [Bacteroidota bacterium]
MGIFTVDIINERYLIQYNDVSDRYTLTDISINKTKELKVNYDSKRKTYFIRYSYTHNGKRENYRKTIERIRWELFGEWNDGNKTLIGLTKKDCKRIIKEEYENLGYLVPYSQMRHSKNSLIKKTHLFIERNGGLSLFLELTTELGINNEIYYQDHTGRILRSSFEFKFFSILHYNNIEYEYESFKVGKFIPDFYIPRNKVLIEILGMGSRHGYRKKSQNKELEYTKRGFNYKPILVDLHNPTSSIINSCIDVFGDIKIPDFNHYFRKYSLNGDLFFDKLKELLSDINDGNLKIDDEKEGKGFVQKHRTYYDYVYENYQSVFHTIKELIGYPSLNVERPKNYWKDNVNCEYELEEIFKKEKYIPNVHQSQTTFNGVYVLRQFYSHRGIGSVKKGGEFYEFVETLKLKYGFRDVEKEKIEFQEKQIYDVVMKLYRDEISLTSEGSILEEYRGVYNYLTNIPGGVFQYIKDNIGYPPPHIQRPSGYYKSSNNIEYELEYNWKKYKRLLKFSEIRGDLGKENTYNSLYSIVGIDEFKKGGNYYQFILHLQNTYGHDDIELKEKEDFQNNVIIYLKGLNDGKWNSTTHSCEELGILQKYQKCVCERYGSLFDGVKSEIGFPHPRVGRYRGYYNDIENCKYEIENNIKIFKCLPKYSEIKKPPYVGENTLLGIYDRYKTKSFERGGIFYDFVNKCLSNFQTS